MDIVATHAARHPDKAAIVDGEHTLSWRAFFERRNRVAQALGALGLRAGGVSRIGHGGWLGRLGRSRFVRPVQRHGRRSR